MFSDRPDGMGLGPYGCKEPLGNDWKTPIGLVPTQVRTLPSTLILFRKSKTQPSQTEGYYLS